MTCCSCGRVVLLFAVVFSPCGDGDGIRQLCRDEPHYDRQVSSTAASPPAWSNAGRDGGRNDAADAGDERRRRAAREPRMGGYFAVNSTTIDSAGRKSTEVADVARLGCGFGGDHRTLDTARS